MSAKLSSILLLAILNSVQSEVSFKNVTLWASATDKIRVVESSNNLKENLPEGFTPAIIISGKIPILFENSVTNIDNVRELYFQKNEIREIRKGAFKNLTSVKTLVINFSNLTVISEDIFDLQVEQLQVSFSPVSKIEKRAFEKLPNLKRLILWHNRLEELPHFENINSLEFLDLTENSLSNFRSNFKNLKMLVLKRNKFDSIPDNLSNLQYLDLSGNLITTLPEFLFEKLPHLKAITLSNNHLTSIPGNIFKNASLHQVDLDYNEISYIDSEAFNDMPNLANINLSGNKLTKYDVKWFQNSPNIYRLFISNNLIDEISEGAFRNVYKGKNQWIKLDGNRIRKIANFDGLKLDYLDLSHNEIGKWNEDLRDVEIYYLDLVHNKIECPGGEFEKVFIATVTYLGDNPLSEECVKEIEEWVKKNPKKIVCTKNPCFY